jgi:ketosteroid isomerase-like protein
MSQENVETLREALRAFARRDRSAWNELCDPNVEVIPVGDWPEGEIQGREAAWDFFVAAEEPWEPGSYEMVEVIDDDDYVVARLQRDMRGRSSGVAVHYDYWLVLTARAGKALRLEWFERRDDALEAAGLSA